MQELVSIDAETILARLLQQQCALTSAIWSFHPPCPSCIILNISKSSCTLTWSPGASEELPDDGALVNVALAEVLVGAAGGVALLGIEVLVGGVAPVDTDLVEVLVGGVVLVDTDLVEVLVGTVGGVALVGVALVVVLVGAAGGVALVGTDLVGVLVGVAWGEALVGTTVGACC